MYKCVKQIREKLMKDSVILLHYLLSVIIQSKNLTLNQLSLSLSLSLYVSFKIHNLYYYFVERLLDIFKYRFYTRCH